jgi:hypothetical protein
MPGSVLRGGSLGSVAWDGVEVEGRRERVEVRDQRLRSYELVVSSMKSGFTNRNCGLRGQKDPKG